MAVSSGASFRNWVDQHNLPKTVERCLLSERYDTIDSLKYLMPVTIDTWKLNIGDKNILKRALQSTHDADYQSDEYQSEYAASQDQYDNESENSEFLNLSDENQSENENHSVEYLREKGEILKWKEFGSIRNFDKWNKALYSVETFSPEGFWAWNPNTKGLVYKRQKIDEIWFGFDDSKPNWIMSPPVLLPSNIGVFKLVFNLRLYPKSSDGHLKLQLHLRNEKYNKIVSNIFRLPLEFIMILKYINLLSGTIVGKEIKVKASFDKLHGSIHLNVPDNVLNLKKAPIIWVQISPIK